MSAMIGTLRKAIASMWKTSEVSRNLNGERTRRPNEVVSSPRKATPA